LWPLPFFSNSGLGVTVLDLGLAFRSLPFSLLIFWLVNTLVCRAVTDFQWRCPPVLLHSLFFTFPPPQTSLISTWIFLNWSLLFLFCVRNFFLHSSSKMLFDFPPLSNVFESPLFEYFFFPQCPFFSPAGPVSLFTARVQLLSVFFLPDFDLPLPV